VLLGQRQKLKLTSRLQQRIVPDAGGHYRVAVKRLKTFVRGFDELVQAEIKAIKLARNLETEHLIKALAYCRQGKEHFILFPWATKGDLEAFWTKTDPQNSDAFTTWIVTQLAGMAGAIEELHKDKDTTGEHCRHGDIKPGNILCFEGDAGLPARFVIADVGLARIHQRATEDRHHTVPPSSTIKYEAPEVKLAPLNAPRSRLMDIWSLGCVFLELVVWMLYGHDELKRLRGDLWGSTPFYQEIDLVGGGKTAQVHPAVQHWIRYMKGGPLSNTKFALRMLLDLIETRLLVVPVKTARAMTFTSIASTIEEDGGVGNGIPKIVLERKGTDLQQVPLSGYRADAEEMTAKLKEIVEALKQGRIHPVGAIDSEKANQLTAPPNYDGGLHPNDGLENQVR